MSSLARRSQQRRAERAPLTAEGAINLVPLIDILTSIVFFGLLTLSSGVMSQLTAYDLTLPPVVIEARPGTIQEDKALTLLLAVRIDNTGINIEHSEEGGFKQKIPGITDQSLDQLQGLMTQIRQKYKQNNDVLVIPDDNVSYDNVIKVLERLRFAQFGNIALGNRARQVASAGGAAGPGGR